MSTPTYKIVLLALVLIFTACKAGKTTAESNNIAIPRTSTLEKKHHESEPKFNTFAAKVGVSYRDQSKEQSLTVSTRVEKDKKIWIKASLLGVTLFKALITPEKVSYYETLNKTYFEGDFTLLSNWLGTDVTFTQVQNILLGQSLFEFNKNSHNLSLEGTNFLLRPQKNQTRPHQIAISPTNFKIAYTTIEDKALNTFLRLQYSEYQEKDTQFFPKKIALLMVEGNTHPTRVDILFKRLDLNPELKFPFRIPQGYKAISL